METTGLRGSTTIWVLHGLLVLVPDLLWRCLCSIALGIASSYFAARCFLRSADEIFGREDSQMHGSGH